MKWDKPQRVNGPEQVFGGSMKRLLPAWNEIPEEFRNMNRGSFWNDFVSDMFFNGVKKEELPKVKVKPCIDEAVAWGHIRSVLGSFQPKHEHKTSGVAWLMSKWFEEPKSA